MTSSTMVTPFFLASRRDRFWIAIGVIVGISESIGDPVATIMVGRMFRDLQHLLVGSMSSHEFTRNIRNYSIGIAAVSGYTLVMNWLGYIVWVSIGYRQGHAARHRLYRGIILCSPAWYDCHREISGLAITYFKDIQDLEMAAGITAYEITSMATGFGIQIGVAFYYSWAITLVCLAGIPVLALIGSLFSPKITRRIGFTKSLLDQVSERVTWVLGAIQTVKIFQRERYEWLYVRRALTKYQQATIGYWLLFKLQEGLCRSIILMIFLQGFYFGYFMVKKHGLNAGNVVTVFFSCLAASGLLMELLSHLVEWNKGNASAKRLCDILNLEDTEEALHNSIGLMPDHKETAATAANLERLGWSLNSASPGTKSDINESTTEIPLDRVNSLDSGLSLNTTASFDSKVCITSHHNEKVLGHAIFSDVVFSYPARQETVLAGLSLEFTPGSLTFVLGASGAGKSTIAALLSRQYPWQAGEVTIDGHSVDLLSKTWIERNVYVVEQMPKLFDISIFDNIRIGSSSPHSVTAQQVVQLCNMFCADFVWSLPMKLETSGNYPLSGGQVQRISLCRALMNDASIMVFDEAISALDSALGQDVMKHITKYRKDKTTIVITHDSEVIPENFPVYVVNDGVAKRYSTIAQLIPSRNNLLESRKFDNGVDSMHNKLVDVESASLECSKHRMARVSNCIFPGNPRIKRIRVKTNISLFNSIPDKGLFFSGLFITILHAAINPVFSFVFSKLIMGILNPAKSRVTLWAMLVLTCAMLDGITTFLTVALNVAGEKWLTSIREQLFSQLLDCQDTKFSHKQYTSLSKLIMSDAEKCAEILTLYWPGLLSMLVLGLVGIIWSMITGWKLTLVGISLFPAFFIVNQLYKFSSTRWTAKRETLRADVMQLLSDLLSPAGFRTLKLQHLERFFQQFYDKREATVNALTSRMVFEIGFGYGILKSFPYILESLVLWYGMHLTVNGYYSAQATMTVFSLTMFTIITIDQLTSSIGSVGTGFEAVNRLMQVLSEVKSSSKSRLMRQRSFTIDKKDPEWKSICYHRTEVTLSSGTQILQSFSAEFRDSETVAILGPSGIGKSTIARLLLKLQRPSKGEIVIDQRWDLESLSDFEVRQNVAIVGQMPLDFYEGTIEENLLYALDSNDISGPAKMVDVCKLCGVHDFVAELDDGYSTRIKSGLLSVGQMQRLGIARAVLRMPKVLILDECTSALDPQSKHKVMSLIKNLKDNGNMIIIIITHQKDVASIADRLIELTKI